MNSRFWSVLFSGALIITGAGLSMWPSSEANAQVDLLAVKIDHSGNDQVGKRLAFAVRERVRKSAGMRLVPQDYFETNYLLVTLVSLDTSPREPGSATAAALTYSLDGQDMPGLGIHLTTFVQSCGSSRVDTCADGIAANIDDVGAKTRQNYPAFTLTIRSDQTSRPVSRQSGSSRL